MGKSTETGDAHGVECLCNAGGAYTLLMQLIQVHVLISTRAGWHVSATKQNSP